MLNGKFTKKKKIKRSMKISSLSHLPLMRKVSAKYRYRTIEDMASSVARASIARSMVRETSVATSCATVGVVACGGVEGDSAAGAAGAVSVLGVVAAAAAPSVGAAGSPAGAAAAASPLSRVIKQGGLEYTTSPHIHPRY